MSSSPSDPFESAPPCGEESRPAPDEIIGAAVARLAAALEALDRAVSLHNERRTELNDQEAEYSALQEDRSRLAQALDAANGRIETLQETQIEARARVERASAAVRAILASTGEG